MLTFETAEPVEQSERAFSAAAPRLGTTYALRVLRVAAWVVLGATFLICLEYLVSMSLRAALVDVIRWLILSRLGSAR